VQFKFRPIDRQAAARIVGWRYEAPYDFHNMGAAALPALLAPESARGPREVNAAARSAQLIGFATVS
jgi:hypothetical protein